MSVALPPPLSSIDQARFGNLVRSASGIEVPPVRRAELELAVGQALAATGSADTEALFLLLKDERGRPALDTMVEALTIGETHFFRNRPQFDALADHILPELIERRRGARQLRFWSAGCASGEEAYSLAILTERLLPDLDQWQVLILATDINRQSLAKAQRGVYSPWSFREVPLDVQGTYFTQRGREFEIVPRLRERVTFAYLNLVEDTYPSLLSHTHTMDLILFRNVLIYFRQATARRVIERMHGALAEGGWLVLGHADPSPGIFEQFAMHNLPGTVVYRKERQKEKEKDAARDEESAQAVMVATRAADRVIAKAVAPALKAAAFDPYQDAFSLWQRGHIDAALRSLTALAAAQPRDARAPYLAAKIEANRQQLAQAETLVDEALRRAPLHAPAHYLHGLILQETGRPVLALAALRRCVYADPQFVLGHYALANLLSQTGQSDRGRKALENVSRWLAEHPRDELVAEGDGLTAGRLTELVAAQKELM
jgi:chemotaxis protein methyltransferase CheR